jgi:hypothetical protein
MRDPSLDTLLGPPERADVPLDLLIPSRVRDVLVVSSLYDSFTFVEDGQLSELLVSEYLELNLRYAPRIVRVSTAEEALLRLRSESFDLVISMLSVGDMDVRRFGRAVHELDPELPLVLLAHNARELALLEPLEKLTGVRRVFVWQGDAKLFLAIMKSVEDRANAWHDARTGGVRVILLVEDSVQFYSSYLPMLYTEVLKQTQALMAEGVNRMQKMLRLRARPKILLATSYEEGRELLERYRDDLLGVIVDAAFPWRGRVDSQAGFAFAELARAGAPDLPILMQSGSAESDAASARGLAFIDKNSPRLLEGLRGFMEDYLGFGDFIFRRPDGSMVSRAADLRHLEWALEAIPDDSLLHHAGRNDFSTWLFARTEFELARALRPRRVEEFGSPDELRAHLLAGLRSQKERARAGVVAEFSSRTFEGGAGFIRIGSGSLGGKGRGLAFMNSVLHAYRLERRFPDVRVAIPPTLVLTTSVFDRFMEDARLLPLALGGASDEALGQAFLASDFPEEVVDTLWTFLDWVRYPLAVRSSSLLEDASFQPFAGIYETYMIPNDHEDPEVRLEELLTAIKMVYASTYSAEARAYIDSTPNRLEEEKMAVVIQQVHGRRHGEYLYPDLAGVARSLNYYPGPGTRPEDGVASVALGLGRTVVEGGRCVRFSPAHPRRPLESFSTADHLRNSQREFYALRLPSAGSPPPTGAPRRLDLSVLDLEAAEAHGTLDAAGSVYSADNDRIYDGVRRPGVRLVTLAGVLKNQLCPLAEVLSLLLRVGSAAFSCPVEMEFALNLAVRPDEPHEFGFLQIRPLVFGGDLQDIQLDRVDTANAICTADQVLGNGLIEGVRDIVYVRPAAFDRSRTKAVAAELGPLNARLKEERRPYLLLGPGRWGSGDPWLGIPVRWAQISAARCIVETDLADMHVEPSQGSHFSQNLVSFGIGYLTVGGGRHATGTVDYAWLDAQPAETETPHLRHLALPDPLPIALSGKKSVGVVLKPGVSLSEAAGR